MASGDVAGDREGAERVARIRKPTVAAWGMNRASRDEPRLVRALVDASDRLRDVQSRGARSAALKEASSARRRAVEHLADAAKAELGDAGESHEDEITQTLLAAATDAETRQTIYHEAVHWFTTASDTPQPLWFAEGLAEVLSTFEVVDPALRREQ